MRKSRGSPSRLPSAHCRASSRTSPVARIVPMACASPRAPAPDDFPSRLATALPSAFAALPSTFAVLASAFAVLPSAFARVLPRLMISICTSSASSASASRGSREARTFTAPCNSSKPRSAPPSFAFTAPSAYESDSRQVACICGTAEILGRPVLPSVTASTGSLNPLARPGPMAFSRTGASCTCTFAS